MSEMISSVAQQFDRLPPSDIEAEFCTLGSMMLGNEIDHAEITNIVGRDEFYQADHQIIFDVICDLRRKGSKVDAVILRSELDRRQLLEEIGGTSYLGTILASVPSAAHGVHYAKIVHEKATLRAMISFGNDILRRAYGASRDDIADEMVQEGIAELTGMLERGRGTEIHKLGDVLLETYEQIEAGGAQTVSFGFSDMDLQSGGGIGVGEMIVIAARPSMGKSTLIKQIALRSAMNGVPVGIISLEEGRFKMGRNILSSECRIENQKLRNSRTLNKDDWAKLADGVARLNGLEIYIVDNKRRLSDIKSAAAIMVARHGVKMIIIDYLQRIKGVGGTSKYEQVSNTSTEISDMFKELGVAGIAVAQLNRAVENRDDKRPLMADLRDSGQIEQDADGVLFLHREDYYHLDETGYEPTSLAEVIFAKYRDGVRGKTVKLQSDLRFQTFTDQEYSQPNLTQL